MGFPPALGLHSPGAYHVAGASSLHNQRWGRLRLSCALTLLALVAFLVPALSLQPVPEGLMKCINNGISTKSTTYQDFVDGKAARLKLQRTWWSERRPSVDLTIVTGLTPSRLEQLEAQCTAWKGPLSAVVYLGIRGNASNPSTADLDMIKNVTGSLDEFHKKVEAAKEGCALDLMMLVEFVADDTMAALLPINTMRNYGLIQARTRLVSMVDVDLLPSRSLYDWLKAPGNMDWLSKESAQKKIFVLPAFETTHNDDLAVAHQTAANAAAADKQALEKMVDAKLVYQFALFVFKTGHNCTNYPKWFSTNSSFKVKWSKNYEPWFIVDRFLNPFYDSVFRGYGWNKVTHVTNANAQGFEFWVHPAGFLVHRQHDRSKAGIMYQQQKKSYEKEAKEDPKKGEQNTSLAGMTHRFRNRVLAQLQEGTYNPVIDAGVTSCVGQLEWWRRSTPAQYTPAVAAAAGGGPQGNSTTRLRRLKMIKYT